MKSEYNTIYRECVVLKDNNDHFDWKRKVIEVSELWPKDEIFKMFKEILLGWILEDYDSVGTRRNKLRKIKEKLWWRTTD